MQPTTGLRLVKGVRILIGTMLPFPFLFAVLIANAVTNEYFRYEYDRTRFWLINGTIIALFVCVGVFIAWYRRNSMRFGICLSAMGTVLLVALFNRLF